jgi:hypothetical protein
MVDILTSNKAIGDNTASDDYYNNYCVVNAAYPNVYARQVQAAFSKACSKVRKY